MMKPIRYGQYLSGFILRRSLFRVKSRYLHASSQLPQTSAGLDVENLPGPSGEWVKGLSSQKERLLLKVREEYHLAKYVEERIPEKMKEEDWEALLEFESTSSRMRYLYFLHKKEVDKEKDLMEKEIRRQQMRQEREEKGQYIEDCNHIVYSLHKNSLFFRFHNSYINQCYDTNVAHALQYGPKICLDMEWFYDLNPSQKGLTLNQIQGIYGINHEHTTPADIILTSFREEPKVQEMFGRYIQGLDPNHCTYDAQRPLLAMSKSEKSFVDLFPRHKIVYLSPDAKFEMEEFDSDKVYVIAGLVDKLTDYSAGKSYQRATLGKAKSLGVRAERIPLERYVKWYSGGKKLPLNHVVGMLLDMYYHGDWEKAIRTWVAKRKIQPSNHVEFAAALRKNHIKKNANLASLVSGRARF